MFLIFLFVVRSDRRLELVEEESLERLLLGIRSATNVEASDGLVSSSLLVFVPLYVVEESLL